jgi:hypothetical protein
MSGTSVGKSSQGRNFDPFFGHESRFCVASQKLHLLIQKAEEAFGRFRLATGSAFDRCYFKIKISRSSVGKSTE